jgi:hypothetical protein
MAPRQWKRLNYNRRGLILDPNHIVDRGKEVIFMIELFLSTDGKHTVHIAADTFEQMAELAPKAKALYQKVLQEFGTKAQMWHTAGNGKGNGYAPFGKRIDTVEQAREAVTPHCPLHHTPMKYREGRLGPFFSCGRRKHNGAWCEYTQEVTETGIGHAATI